ncbi:uncharacterized protein LOC124622423 [Schistocerca americana]|uniref:uncharacterized protein LOC124622423 n=1 Tax=Schistocerca americana TaxID=7009 RepID=UPI001F4F35E3|nr:uncharacterized protein LOC124622423 [Schistocerca americana]XP_047121070.1 uncharacterized protein LOC124804787 [Schistocerca piceifrons]XP_049765341.1 uncharacterized protein LOC126094811 [Schistocerca cancellata]XP_049791465.1 uncharacterized protein LOC126198892 [Schistocerca nitens]XP_049837004.1 uncharacterized protein LOC126281818 [Schistocerca gregaria]XP_049938060.1 uncharacterized protein LOC126412483 [Schistocerca serialis cubense]
MPVQEVEGWSVERSWGTETMSGPMTMIGPDKRRAQPVQVKVYRTSLEHFAVVFPQKKVCRPLGVVNLRHATLSRLDGDGAGAAPAFSVRHKGCDAADASLTFVAATARDLDAWLHAFSSRSASPAALPLPAVAEDEEA